MSKTVPAIADRRLDQDKRLIQTADEIRTRLKIDEFKNEVCMDAVFLSYKELSKRHGKSIWRIRDILSQCAPLVQYYADHHRKLLERNIVAAQWGITKAARKAAAKLDDLGKRDMERVKALSYASQAFQMLNKTAAPSDSPVSEKPTAPSGIGNALADIAVIEAECKGPYPDSATEKGEDANDAEDHKGDIAVQDLPEAESGDVQAGLVPEVPDEQGSGDGKD
jgi:hypothetical protein